MSGIEILSGAPLDQAREFYERYNHPGPDPDDRVFLALHESSPIGVVRLCPGEGYSILRTMRIDERFQRKGIGTTLLRAFEKEIPEGPCFCIAFAHLETYYGQIGFTVIDSQEAPAELRERFQEYRGRGFNVILMKR